VRTTAVRFHFALLITEGERVLIAEHHSFGHRLERPTLLLQHLSEADSVRVLLLHSVCSFVVVLALHAARGMYTYMPQ